MPKQKHHRLVSKFSSAARVAAVVAFVSLVGVLQFGEPRSVEAATNQTINFQARLLSATGSVVADGTYNVEFKLYATDSGGTALWTETRINTDRVRVVNGYLTVNLGSVTTFPTTINWDQELWMTMNIGGLTGSPSWDGEMSPRLKLTSVPFAKRSGELAGGTGANTTRLTTGTPSGTNTIQLPAESGTVCLQGSSNCNFALATGGANYIQNQTGVSQAASFRINGTGRADTALQAPVFDRADSGTLILGGTNATALQIGSLTADQSLFMGTSSGANTIAIGTGATSSNANTIIIGTTNAASSLTLRAGTGHLLLNTNSASAKVIVQSSINTVAAFEIQNASSNAILTADTTNGQIILGKASTITGKMAFLNASNANVVTVQSGVTTTGYTLTLPTNLGSAGFCLKDATGSGQLEFSSCGATGGTLQSAYDAGSIINTTNARSIAVNLTETSTDSSFSVNMQCTTCSTNGGRFEIQNAGTAVFWLNPGSADGQRGTAVFRNSANDTNAFQVQTSTGTTVINVDTTNSRLGIGTASPQRTFHTAINNTQTTAPMALLEQAGTGDATLEFKTPSKSFILGQDASDASSFKLSSSTASASSATIGYTAAGASTNNGSNGLTACTKYTAAATGSVTSMSVYVNSVDPSPTSNRFQVGIYSDDGGSPSSPSTRIANSAEATLTAANVWVSTPISASITSGSVYWLCYQTNASASTYNNPTYDNNGTANQFAFQFNSYGTWNNSFGTVNGRNSIQPSVYATYTPTGSYDSFTKSLFKVTDSGQATFQNSTDSSTSFQIQNAAGVALMTADTSNNRLYVGPPGGSATGYLLVLGNKSGSSDPTGLNGAMYYNTTTSRFRCYGDSAWRPCGSSLTYALTTTPASISNTTTETNFAPTYTIPADDCQPGRSYRITAQGTMSTTGTPTIQLRLKWGTTTILTTSAIPTGNNSASRSWRMEAAVVCYTAGAGGTVFPQGFTTIGLTSTTIGGSDMSATATVGVDTTVAQTVAISAQWGAASASNAIAIRQLMVEAL